MKRLPGIFLIVFLLTSHAATLHAERRDGSQDPILEQWVITREALVSHIKAHYLEGEITGGESLFALGEIGKLRESVLEFRNAPVYAFMVSDSKRLTSILDGLETGIVDASDMLRGPHSTDQVIFAASGLQDSVTDYLYFRVTFAEKVNKYYIFIILFFVASCVIVVVLISVFRDRLRILERDRAYTSKFARTIINAQESERIAIARELHDTVAQEILCVKVATETLQRNLSRHGEEYSAAFAELINTETTCINRIRDMCAELRPPELVHLGLTAAVTGLCKAFEKSTGIVCRCILYGEYSLGPEEEINCYRIIQESLSNVRKHSRATAASVWLECLNEPLGAPLLMLRISDNGIGINLKDTLLPVRNTFGLKGMRERVRILGGDISIVPGNLGGTVVTITIPLTDDSAESYTISNEKPDSRG